MNLPLAMAVRVQVTIDDLVAAVKQRPAEEVEAEQRLVDALRPVLGPVIDHVAGYVGRHGIPADDVQAAAAVGELGQVQDQLVVVLEEHVGAQAAAAVTDVEAAVTAARDRRRARKQLPRQLADLGIDGPVSETLARLGGSMVQRYTDRTIDAIVEAGGRDIIDHLETGQLRSMLGEMLEGELSQLSRHAIGDARNEAVEVAERALGVRRHRWVTSGDDDVRESHAAVDGEVAEIGRPFSNGWRRPGGVGCRCRLEPIVDAEPVALPPAEDMIQDPDDPELFYARESDVGNQGMAYATFEADDIQDDVRRLRRDLRAAERGEDVGDDVEFMREQLQEQEQVLELLRQLKKLHRV